MTRTVLSEVDAVARAIEYLKKEEIGFAICCGGTRLGEGQTDLWRTLFKDALPSGTWLWQVDFEYDELPPNTDDTGNDFTVFVDQMTGACAIFWGM